MASKQAAPGEESEQLKQLQSDVERLYKAIDNEADGNHPDRDDLNKICEVLKEIKGKITPKDAGKGDDEQQQLLPLSKREELAMLLPTIELALQQRKQQQQQEQEGKPTRKKTMLSATGCNPFKLRPGPSQQQQAGGGGKEEEAEAVSLKLLLRLTRNVLEPEQYYEWTTSYVDEERIYGWDKEADEVVTALVGGPEDGQRLLFRAAGITGIHGSGKTALAQKVFVHDKAKDNFPLRLWVCVGPPDSEDRFGLLYRMLDNLGLDTAKVESIVRDSKVVKDATKSEEDRMIEDAAVEEIRKKAAAESQKEAAGNDATKKEEEDRIFKKLLEEKADNSPAVQKSKIGVLLYILHMTLSNTGYLIVFDDIRAYGDDGWYSNLTLPPPPEGEWGDRLAYGLPKGSHKSAVLVTCRKEDDARSMVRTGRVFRPPKLEVDHAWKLFEREYKQAKDAKSKKDGGKGGTDNDLLLKELEEMKEDIVKKCLGLPVAIAEAARGFATLDPLPDAASASPPPEEAAAAAAKPAEDQTRSSKEDVQAEEAEAADKSED